MIIRSSPELGIRLEATNFLLLIIIKFRTCFEFVHLKIILAARLRRCRILGMRDSVVLLHISLDVSMQEGYG